MGDLYLSPYLPIDIGGQSCASITKWRPSPAAVVETPVFNTFLSDAQVKEVPPPFNAFHPLGRNGQPRDVSETILFLASNQASWITGVVLSADGGVTAGSPNV